MCVCVTIYLSNLTLLSSQVHKVREKFVAALERDLPDLGLKFTIGIYMYIPYRFTFMPFYGSWAFTLYGCLHCTSLDMICEYTPVMCICGFIVNVDLHV